jgi:fructose-bisphosphate aldolase class I
LPGIVFLSGGQSSQQATENLNEIVKMGAYPWRITFSYSRALQEPVMVAWAGKDENKQKAQEIFTGRVKETALASEGKLIANAPAK